jgi:hypothetical protein
MVLQHHLVVEVLLRRQRRRLLRPPRLLARTADRAVGGHDGGAASVGADGCGGCASNGRVPGHLNPAPAPAQSSVGSQVPAADDVLVIPCHAQDSYRAFANPSKHRARPGLPAGAVHNTSGGLASDGRVHGPKPSTKPAGRAARRVASMPLAPCGGRWATAMVIARHAPCRCAPARPACRPRLCTAAAASAVGNQWVHGWCCQLKMSSWICGSIV